MHFIEYFRDKGMKADVVETFADAWNYYKASTGDVGTLAEPIKHNRN